MSACYVILAHVTWALAREWALFIRAAKTVTWALTRDTTVHVGSEHTWHTVHCISARLQLNNN